MLQLSWKIVRRSSYPRAHDPRWVRVVRHCCLWLVLIGTAVPADDDTGNRTFRFDIPSQPADSALTEFAEQADLTLVFPDEMVRDRTANALIGEYSLEEGAAVLLESTGLIPSFSNRIVLNITIDDTSTSGKEAMNATKKAGLIAIIASVLTGGAGAQEPREAEQETQTSIVTGKVTDARTGANLKGARVAIQDTGQWTSTNDLGEFRFVNVQTGDVTLTVSYLGYAEQSAVVVVTGDGAYQSFALRGGSGLEEIVVYGQRSARALALNQERTAENSSTVFSSNLLGEFGGQTLSETLRRAPGVSFQRDDFTGDGTNIIIRGLDPDLNAIKLNGVEIPEGSGVGRSASLANVQTESISEVRISKTLLANQDSSGAGGLVEIETKSPLDRARRFASFSLEGSRRENDFNDEFAASGTVSGTFGSDENTGLSASLQYRDRDIKRIGYSHGLRFGQYLPLQIDGSPSIRTNRQVDPRQPFPFEPGVTDVYPGSLTTSYDLTESEALSLTLSAAHQIGAHTDLRFDYQRSDLQETRFNRRNTFNATTSYLTTPVVSLGGEERRALTWRERVTSSGEYSFLPDVETQTDVYSFQGDSAINKWELSYTLGYAEGTTEIPRYTLSPESRTDQDIDTSLYQVDVVTDPVEGRILSIFPLRTGDGISLPLLTDAGFDFFNDPARFNFSGAGFDRQLGYNERLTLDFGAKYNVEHGSIRYIEAGISFENSEFGSEEADDGFFYEPNSPNPSFQDLGIGFDEPSLADVGISNGFRVISISDLERFLLTDLPRIAVTADDPAAMEPGALVVSEQQLLPQFRPSSTSETEIAAYIQGRLDIGRLEVIGGLRLSSFEIESTNVQGPFILDADFREDVAFTDANTILVTETATQTEALPRVLMNYRWSDNTLFRAGYFQSIGRPQIELLSDNVFILLQEAPLFGPDRDLPQLRVTKGNSDLESAKTHSFDLSFEHYDDATGVIKLGLFYKRIDNLLESNVTEGVGALSDVVLPDDSRFQDVLDNPNSYDIVITIPENNPDTAEIWGLEAVLEKQFTGLPGAFSGLGIFANYTYTDSSKDQPISTTAIRTLLPDGSLAPAVSQTVIIDDVVFNNQPKHSGTFGITYNKHNIDANIAYTAQSRRQTSFLPNGLSDYEEAFDTLDMRFEYRIGSEGAGNYRVFFEGADLLRGPEDPGSQTTRGRDDGVTSKYFADGRYFGGRQLRLGFITTF